MRLFLCGQKHYGAAVLDAVLKAGHTVVGVSSPRWANEKLDGRYDQPGEREDRLFALSRLKGVDWRPAGTLRAHTVPERTDVIVCAHSHDFLGRPTRGAARLGAIGYHPSLLPLHRGRDAVRWAVRMHERVTGGSIYWLTDRVDAGPLAAQDWCFIRPDDTAQTLWRRELHPMGVRLTLKVLADLDGGRLVSVKQDDALATWEPAFGAPMLHRPELPALGPGPAGFRMEVSHDALH